MNNQILYASLPRRIKASIIDSVVVLALFIVMPLVVTALTGKQSMANAVVMFAPLLLLEPLLVSFCGFTVGQYLCGIEVVRAHTGEKCQLLNSFLRYILKSLLGLFSMVYMLFSQRHQAIHDHAANTVVVLSRKRLEMNPDFVQFGETEQVSDEDAEYVYPTKARRFGFFCLWVTIVGFLFGIVIEAGALLFLPGYTLETEKLPPSLDKATDVVGLLLFIGTAVVASKGYLPGARRKKKEVEKIMTPSRDNEWF